MNYVALLRGINVGGNKKIAMGELRAVIESLGFTNVRTLLNSGNVVFAGPKQSTATLATRLHNATANELGVESEYFVRTASEWADIIERNPMIADAERDPSHFLVMTCKGKLDPKCVAELRDA